MVDRLGQESIYTFSTCSYHMKHHLNHPNPYWHRYPRLMSTSITVLNSHADGRSLRCTLASTTSMKSNGYKVYENDWIVVARADVYIDIVREVMAVGYISYLHI